MKTKLDQRCEFIMAVNNKFYIVFVVLLLSTEFFYIDLFGGSLRIYHFLSPLVIFFLFGYFPYLTRTSLFWSFSCFFFVNAVAAAFSVFPTDAFMSLGLVAANMSIAFAVALILVSGRLRLEQMVRIILAVTIISILFGVLQVLCFRLAGVCLALSPSQVIQIKAGFSAGLRTEANSFGKNLNVVTLLILPSLLIASNWRRSLLICIVLVTGMLMSFTRSSQYGLIITLVIIYFWHQFIVRFRLITPKAMVLLGVASVGLLIYATIAPYFNEYSAHKIAFYFDPDEIFEGGSSLFRLMSQKILWDAFVINDKTQLIGNGWGQVYFLIGNIEWQAGGAEFITVLSYGGIFSGLFYLMFQVGSMHKVSRMIFSTEYHDCRGMYEGVLFALIGLFVTGQINGALNSPEYWMMYGVALYCASKLKYGNKNC